ncbi:MAG: Hemolysin transporter protein ShlB [Candidatus Celerinatantimonas neptuna]|nr:MAG: Hemolysin transporter protein ShlB [Candidatus Celerinatantimonas neptuna]CAG9001004.1 MAG: Hemolysin transporter protein ShlB [Candidatus Celerinatantimonas neptuna]
MNKRTRAVRALSGGVCCALLLGSPMARATVPESAIVQAIRLQQKRAALKRRQALVQQQHQRLPQRQALPSPLVTGVTGQRCERVRTIRITGNHVISSSRLSALARPYGGHCLGLAQINALLKQITFVYMKRGYVASRAYLPQQDLASGQLHIVIVEGTLTRITFHEPVRAPHRLAAMIFPGLTGQPVNLRAIEQGLDQLNRLPSWQARTALHPGARPGQSRLLILGQPGKAWRLSASADNQGSRSTGHYDSGLGLVVDNPAGLGDQVSVHYQHSMADSPLAWSKDRHRSDDVMLSYSVPYGNWLVRMNGSDYWYHSRLQGNLTPIQTSGTSRSWTLGASRMVFRDRVSKTHLSLSLGWQSSHNDVDGTQVDVTSHALTTLTLGVSHVRRWLGGQLSASLDDRRGLPWWGAAHDHRTRPQTPKSEFNLVDAQFGFYRPFQLGQQRCSWNAQLSGQWSPERLYSSQQLTLGGANSVRGLSYALFSGNNGVWLRNTLAWAPQLAVAPGVARWLGSIEPYLGLDAGQILSQQRLAIDGGHLVGGSLGLRSVGGRVHLELTWSHILAYTRVAGQSGLGRGVLYASLAMTY